MTDIALRFGNEGIDVDLSAGPDLLAEDGLQTALLLSLFLDARAETPPDGEGPRGAWHDSASDRHGSLLWLLDREKSTDEVAARAEEYVAGALEWLLEDGIAERVSVVASYDDERILHLEVEVQRGSARQWASLWDKSRSFGSDGGGLQVNFIQ